MPAVTKPANQKGDFLVDYEDKVFEDVQAGEGEKALVTFHTVAFEGSIGFVNLLQATRLKRKGFETSILLYGPLLSGLNLVDKVHGVDSTRIRAFGD
ncbi:MSMEG_0572/Sll0783 family nitrogen starvation response protein, partial [Rhizobium ruizarguesonis]